MTYPAARSLLLLIHAEHALRDEEAAKDVNARHDQRDEAEQLGNPAAGRDAVRLDRDGEQRADHDHRRDGIGDRHQRCMQGGRDAPYDVVTDEDREHEDREAHYEVVTLRAWRRLCEGITADQASGQQRQCENRNCSERRSTFHALPPFGAGRFAAPFFFAAASVPFPAFAFGEPARSAIIVLTMMPSRPISVPLTSSSSQLTASAPVFLSIIGSMKASRLRA